MNKNTSSYDRKKPDPTPVAPSRSTRLLNEAWWFVLIVATIYFFLIFLTFDKADPGWSHASQTATISNIGGRIGAWISDLLFFTFGIVADSVDDQNDLGWIPAYFSPAYASGRTGAFLAS